MAGWAPGNSGGTQSQAGIFHDSRCFDQRGRSGSGRISPMLLRRAETELEANWLAAQFAMAALFVSVVVLAERLDNLGAAQPGDQSADEHDDDGPRRREVGIVVAGNEPPQERRPGHHADDE